MTTLNNKISTRIAFFWMLVVLAFMAAGIYYGEKHVKPTVIQHSAESKPSPSDKSSPLISNSVDDVVKAGGDNSH